MKKKNDIISNTTNNKVAGSAFLLKQFQKELSFPMAFSNKTFFIDHKCAFQKLYIPSSMQNIKYNFNLCKKERY